MPKRIGSGAILLAFFILLGAPQEAGAHGILLESTPKAGQTVASVRRLDLRFNSRIEPALSQVRVIGPADEQVPVTASPSETTEPSELMAALPALPPGLYTVQWRVFTVDGHVSHGSFSFRLAAPAQDP